MSYHVSSSTEGWYVVADAYTGRQTDLAAGPFKTQADAEAAAAQFPKTGATYRVNPRYGFHYKLTVKVLDVMHAWTDHDGVAQVAVWVRRVRPNDLNVTFGGDHGLVARADQFELLAEPVRHANGDVAGGSYSLAKLD